MRLQQLPVGGDIGMHSLVEHGLRLRQLAAVAGVIGAVAQRMRQLRQRWRHQARKMRQALGNDETGRIVVHKGKDRHRQPLQQGRGVVLPVHRASPEQHQRIGPRAGKIEGDLVDRFERLPVLHQQHRGVLAARRQPAPVQIEVGPRGQRDALAAHR